MKKTCVALGALALAAWVAAPLVLAADPHFSFPGRDRGLWRAARYNQKHHEPGPRIPTPPPKDPDSAAAHGQASRDVMREAAGAAVGFSGSRAGSRTVREVERDSVRKTIRNLG